MVIQIHQKTGDLGEGSTHTTSDCNEEMENDKEEENMQAPEPEPQSLADEGERIPGIVEEMEKEEQDAPNCLRVRPHHPAGDVLQIQ